MAQISFYHTTGETPAALDGVLPSLLQKAVASGQKVLLVAPTAARCRRLDEALWSFAESSFMPHAMVDDPHPAEQPILLASAEADVTPHVGGRIPVIVTGAEGALAPILGSTPSRVLYMFTAAGADVERARPLFKQLKAEGHQLAYWQQTASGWQQKS
jgi:DNA polymerase-3 subunit chi